MSTISAQLVQQWYERYGQGLYRQLCRSVRNKQDAQDISQQAFMKVAAKMTNDEYAQNIENPKAFLYRVAYNELYNRSKQQKLQQHLLGIFAESTFDDCDELTPEKKALAQEELSVINQGIDDLPTKQKQVFLMTRLEHKKHADVASELGIKKDTVKKHVVRVEWH